MARKPLTPARLEKSALWYLERYGASEARFRDWLARRIARDVRTFESDPAPLKVHVDTLVSKMKRYGYLDDKAFAAGRIRRYVRQGLSPRVLRMRLLKAGVSEDIVETLICETGADNEKRAAVRYARRRKLGPFRSDDHREERRQKDLAAMGRAGFSLDVAREIVDALDAETLEVEAAFTPSLPEEV